MTDMYPPQVVFWEGNVRLGTARNREYSGAVEGEPGGLSNTSRPYTHNLVRQLQSLHTISICVLHSFWGFRRFTLGMTPPTPHHPTPHSTRPAFHARALLHRRTFARQSCMQFGVGWQQYDCDRTVVVQVGSLVVLAVWYTLFSSPLVGLLPFLSCLPHPDSSMGAADGRREECEACMGICVWGYVSTRIPRIRSRHTLLYLLRPIMDSIPVAPLPMPPRLAGKTPGFGDRLPSRSPKFMIAAPRPSSPLCL